MATVLVADNLESALAIRDSMAVGESVVTQDGVWLGKDWLYVANYDSQESSVLYLSLIHI